MRITYHFTLGILFIIISCPAFAQQELETFPQSPYLVGHTNPALADVNCLYIAVILRGSYNEPNFSLTTKIENQLEDIFRDSDINVIGTNVDANSPLVTLAKKRFGSASNLRWKPANIPEFRVEVDLLNLADTDQFVFRLQTSFAKRVVLEDIPKANIRADVWTDEPVMSLVPSRELMDSIVAAAVGQAQTFIRSWSAVKIAHNRNEVNQTSLRSHRSSEREKVKAAQQQAIEYNFVASKNSQVFHKPGCPFAQKIASKNLVTYGSREEAIAAGKRPCKSCNP